MTDRGEYRPIFTVLVHGPDYQELAPHAKLVLLHCKLNLGAAGIGVLYASALAEQTGIPFPDVQTALEDLASRGWIVRERNVIWVRDGLSYEPSLVPGNPNHRKWLETHLNGLPRLQIVTEFRAHYPDWCADPLRNPSAGDSEPPRINTTTTTTSTTTTNGGGRRARDTGEPAETGAPLALIVAANQGMRDNPALGNGRECPHPIPHSHGQSVQVATELLREVDPDFARETIYAIAKQYTPATKRDRIRSLAYFADAVRRKWAEHQASEAANDGEAPTVRPRTPAKSRAQETYDHTIAALEGV